MKQPPEEFMFSELNVVPYIDVMLVLLIIFMVSAPLLQTGIEVELPRESANVVKTEDKVPLVVSIDANGQLYLNVLEKPDKPVEERPLLVRLTAELHRNPNRAVYVKGDANATYKQVAHAMAILQKAGAGKIGLVTQGEG